MTPSAVRAQLRTAVAHYEEIVIVPRRVFLDAARQLRLEG